MFSYVWMRHECWHTHLSCLTVCLSVSPSPSIDLVNCQTVSHLVGLLTECHSDSVWLSYLLNCSILQTIWNHVVGDEFVFVTHFQHTLMFLYLILSPCEKHITHKIHRHTFLFWVGLHRNPTWATYFFCFCSAKCDFCCEFRFRSWLTVALPH